MRSGGAVAAKKTEADRFARKLAPIIAETMGQGVTSARQIETASWGIQAVAPAGGKNALMLRGAAASRCQPLKILANLCGHTRHGRHGN